MLQRFTLQMSATLQRFELVDENDLFIDCVRRLEFFSTAKIFIMDNLRYAVSAASDGVCPDSPSATASSAATASTAATSAATRNTVWVHWPVMLLCLWALPAALLTANNGVVERGGRGTLPSAAAASLQGDARVPPRHCRSSKW